MNRQKKVKCGDCNACCVVLGVTEIGKEEFQECPHIFWRGCGIYDTRPSECRNYKCLWLDSFSDEGILLRPDHLGVILDVAEVKKLGVPVLVVREVRPKVFEDPNVQVLVKAAAKSINSLIYLRRGRGQASVIIPDWLSHLRGRITGLVYENIDGSVDRKSVV